MRKLLLIFVLAGCREEEPLTCYNVTISNALPVQIWKNGQASFNQKKEAGVDKICWFQPWNCEDEIKIQMISTVEEETVTCLIKDKKGVQLESIPFDVDEFTKVIEIALQLSTTEFDGDLGDWVNADGSDRASSADWIAGFTPNSARAYSGVGGSQSKYLAIQRGGARGWPPGDYTIELSGVNLSTFSDAAQNLGLAMFGMNDLTSQTAITATNSPGNLPTGGAPNTITYSFTLAVYYEYLAVTLERLGPPGGFDLDGRITNIELTESPTEETIFDYNVHSLEFEFTDYELCSGYYSLEFIDQDDEQIGFTDLLDIKSNHANTLLTQYTNKNTFAGIDYSDEPVFSIRALARFFKPKIVQERESEPDGAGNIVVLSGSVKVQKLLEIQEVPPYMLEKLALIFAHNSVWINNESWASEEPGEEEELDDRSPLYNFSIMLTRQNDNFALNT
jgi:hypothetical protein